MGTREAIEAMRPTKTLAITVDGQTLTIRRLTAMEGQQLSDFQSAKPAPSSVLLMARMAVLSLCDENGRRVFQDGEDEALTGLPFPVLNEVFKQSCVLSGIGKAGQEEAAKN